MHCSISVRSIALITSAILAAPQAAAASRWAVLSRPRAARMFPPIARGGRGCTAVDDIFTKRHPAMNAHGEHVGYFPRVFLSTKTGAESSTDQGGGKRRSAMQWSGVQSLQSARHIEIGFCTSMTPQTSPSGGQSAAFQSYAPSPCMSRKRQSVSLSFAIKCGVRGAILFLLPAGT